MLDAIESGTGLYWEPQGIAHSQLLQAGELSPQQMVGELRRLVKKLSLSDERILADGLLGLIRAMVARLNWLAEAGKLGDAPRGHETWPINYAGKGASKWKAAKSLYGKLGCGEDVIFTRVASKVDYRNRWTALAVDGVRAALLAKQNASAWVGERIKTATFTVHIWRQLQVKQGDWSAQFVRAKREERLGRAKIECDYHLCRDGSVIAWPAWAEKSKSLPDRLTSNNWQRFLPVVRQLVRIFLQQDEKRMHEYLKASVPKKMEYVEKKGWDAFIFDNFLMKKVKSALESLASR